MATVTLPPSGEKAAIPAPGVLEPLKVWRRRLAAGIMKRRVRARDFSIISNDCWGGMAYEELGMRYESPFVGLFIVPSDYIRLLRDLRSNLEQAPRFKEFSSHAHLNRWREEIGRPYPIGVLGDDIEIHFLHYPSREEAEEKWRRRTARIHWENLRVKLSWHDNPAMEEYLREFECIPFGAKISFAPRKIDGAAHCVVLKDFSTDGTQQYWRSHKALDVAAFLESGRIQQKGWTRALDWCLYWHH